MKMGFMEEDKARLGLRQKKRGPGKRRKRDVRKARKNALLDRRRQTSLRRGREGKVQALQSQLGLD